MACIRTHKRQLASSQKVLGVEHPDTLTRMFSVAQAIGNQGNYVFRDTTVIW